MGEARKLYGRRKKAKAELDELFEHPDGVLVIHYSCEDLYEPPDGTSPRITAIAVRYLESGVTKSFSIHKVAEIQNIPSDSIQVEYNGLEKSMLSSFFEFVNQNRNMRWMHWNMRDGGFGFEAIYHRYRVLGGKPIEIEHSKLFDLSRNLISIYGLNYIRHPRLPALVELNNIKSTDFIKGKDEPDAFKKGEYVRLHQSVLRKIEAIANIADRAHLGTLVTEAKFKEKYGLGPLALLEVAQDNRAITGTALILSLICVPFTLFGTLPDLIKKGERNILVDNQQSTQEHPSDPLVRPSANSNTPTSGATPAVGP